MTHYRDRLEAGEFAPPDAAAATATGAELADLDDMSKAQLLAHAQSLGVSPANNTMSKDELRAGIESLERGG